MGGVRHPLKQGPRAAVKSTCLRHTVASVSTNMSDRHVIDLRWSATGDGRKRRDPSPATPTAGSRHARHPPGLGSGSRTPPGRGNTTQPPTTPRPTTKSSFKFRGGSRHHHHVGPHPLFLFQFALSRGGFRLTAVGMHLAITASFQSALRFAAVSDFSFSRWLINGDLVSIRFKVRSGFRLKRDLFDAVTYHHVFQSALRFAVVSDLLCATQCKALKFQSALRFAVVSDSFQLRV